MSSTSPISSAAQLLLLLLAAAGFAPGDARVIVDPENARPPPAGDQSALMARYIVNQADWVSVATVSVRESSEGYPFVSLVALSDGPRGRGSGVLYVFVTPLDYVGQDLQQDQRVTMMVSLAQGDYCAKKGYDPMDPRCPRAIFTGRIEKISQGDGAEFKTAKEAMFGRHPWLAHMPPDHEFYFGKLEIETISVFAKFGGIETVEVEDYYQADANEVDKFPNKVQVRPSALYSPRAI